MTASIRTTLQALLGGIAWLSFGAAAMAFLFGDGVIRAAYNTDRSTAFVESLVAAIGFLILGGAAKIAQDRVEDAGLPESAKSLGDALRK